MDTPILVALLALCGTVITVMGGVVVAIITSNRETKKSAESAVERALRERITLKDEQLADLEADLKREQTNKRRLEEAYRLSQEELATLRIKLGKKDTP